MMSIDKIIQELKARKLTLASAESCTGGRIPAAITAVPGASDVFQGGVVAYQSSVKSELLNVPLEDIEKFDVVSEPVVIQMVKGACKLLTADIALASTGYAGPSSGNPDIPVGTIWIACGSNDKVLTKCLHLNDDRVHNVERAVVEVFGLLADYLSHKV